MLERASTGVRGIDEILRGGLIPQRSYLVRGGPGSGKTILGLHFLSWAARQGQSTLFITLGESEAELRSNGALLGFDVDQLRFLDLTPTSSYFAKEHEYDIFSPAEVEREPITRRIREEVSKAKPTRVFVDGMTQLRYLSSTPFQFRKEALAFLRFLCELGATVLFTSESTEGPDADLQFIADGVIELESTAGNRRIAILKFRGSDFRPGMHSLRIAEDGLRVFPRLVPEDYAVPYEREQIPFGVPELDRLVHGGLERGTITIITGPSGVGKTTLGMQFVHEAASRGERSVVYLFEESAESLVKRCESICIPAREMMQTGMLSVVYVEPLRYTADEFATMVRQEVEERKARIVMLDGIAGYRLSVRDQDLVTHLHALSKYLQNMGVAVLLLNEVENITGDFRVTDVSVSYMSDNIIFLRYYESRGEISKAIGVLKKRLSDFERTLCELTISSEGIRVGRKLTELRGILRGTPEWTQPNS